MGVIEIHSHSNLPSQQNVAEDSIREKISSSIPFVIIYLKAVFNFFICLVVGALIVICHQWTQLLSVPGIQQVQ